MSDGNAGGTVLVKDIASAFTGSGPFWLATAGGKVYFTADGLWIG